MNGIRSIEELQDFQQRLRDNPTHAERHLRHQLDHLKEDYRFQEIIGFYIVDFLLPNRCLIVEVDGGVHRQEENRKRDMKRDAFLKSCGFGILRLTNSQVLTFGKKAIHRALARATEGHRKAFDEAWDEAQRRRISVQTSTGTMPFGKSDVTTLAELETFLVGWVKTASFAHDATFANCIVRNLIDSAATAMRKRTGHIETERREREFQEQRARAQVIAHERATKARLIKKEKPEAVVAFEYAISKD